MVAPVAKIAGKKAFLALGRFSVNFTDFHWLSLIFSESPDAVLPETPYLKSWLFSLPQDLPSLNNTLLLSYSC